MTPSATGTENGINYVQFDAITSFSGGGFGAGVGPGSPLPIELLYFNGFNQGKTNLLRWATAVEENVSHFELQRSKNAVDWTRIATVDAAGNSTTTQTYQHIDNEPYVGNNYYRLITHDVDGTTHNEGIVHLLVNPDKPSMTNLYPNPTSTDITFDIFSPAEEEVLIRISNELGQQVSAETYTIIAGNNTRTIDISLLPPGVYYVHMICCGGENFVQKFVKSNR